MDGRGLKPPTFSLSNMLVCMAGLGALTTFVKHAPPTFGVAAILSVVLIAGHVFSTMIGSRLKRLSLAEEPIDRPRMDARKDDPWLLSSEESRQAIAALPSEFALNASHKGYAANKRSHIQTMAAAGAFCAVIGVLIAVRALFGTPEWAKPLSVSVLCFCGAVLGGLVGVAAGGFWHSFWTGWSQSAATASNYSSYRRAMHLVRNEAPQPALANLMHGDHVMPVGGDLAAADNHGSVPNLEPSLLQPPAIEK